MRVQARREGRAAYDGLGAVALRRVAGVRGDLEEREGEVDAFRLEAAPAVLPAEERARRHALVEVEDVVRRRDDVLGGRGGRGEGAVEDGGRASEEGDDAGGVGLAVGEVLREEVRVDELERRSR